LRKSDRKGKEIKEGDILQAGDEKTRLFHVMVLFGEFEDSNGNKFSGFCLCDIDTFECQTTESTKFKELRIVGNYWDNPVYERLY
jgi:hypothetical protein